MRRASVRQSYVLTERRGKEMCGLELARRANGASACQVSAARQS